MKPGRIQNREGYKTRKDTKPGRIQNREGNETRKVPGAKKQTRKSSGEEKKPARKKPDRKDTEPGGYKNPGRYETRGIRNQEQKAETRDWGKIDKPYNPAQVVAI